MLDSISTLPHDQTQAKRSFDINHQRRRDIARLVVHRHGRLANAALCIPYAIATAWHCPSDGERRFLMVQWCRWTCAPLSVEHQIDAILKANPARRISADTLARHLHVSDAERTALRIWTIGAYDAPKAKRIKRRKEKRRKNRLIYFSPAEIQRLVEQLYPRFVEPRLREDTGRGLRSPSCLADRPRDGRQRRVPG
jgi:hypothetical protein